jgi:hypothetical protein
MVFGFWWFLIHDSTFDNKLPTFLLLLMFAIDGFFIGLVVISAPHTEKIHIVSHDYYDGYMLVLSSDDVVYKIASPSDYFLIKDNTTIIYNNRLVFK